MVSIKTIMFRAHMSVTRIWQLIEKKMMSCISVRGKLPGLQCAVGKNNIWGSFFFCIFGMSYIKDDQYHFFFICTCLKSVCIKSSRLYLYIYVCLFRFLTGEVRRKSSFRQSPLLTATPVRALIDEQISIKGRFLFQNYPVTVWAQMHSEEGDLWEAFAHYTTNASGSINCEWNTLKCCWVT